MSRITPLLLLVGFVVGLVGRPVWADVPAVKDDGEFFSAEAGRKAGAIVDEIARRHGGRRVVIETYNDVPNGKALPEFAAERVKAGGVNGVYVIVVRRGGRVGVVPGDAGKGTFTREECDRLREQLTAGLRKGKPNFDAALLETVGAIRDEFDRQDVARVPGPMGPGSGRATATTSQARPVRSRAEQIFDALTGDVPELRKAAADVLRAAAANDRATAEAAVPRLVEMLRPGADAGARVTAAELLGEIGKGQPEMVKPAVGSLVEALRDNTSNDVRRAAARALESAGPAAREQAAGALKMAAENDADAGVRQEAATALKAVEGEK